MKALHCIVMLALACAAPDARAADEKAAPRKFAAVELGNPRCVALGPDGALYAGDIDGNRIVKVTADGKSSVIEGVHCPTGLAVGKDGTIYVADTDGNAVSRIAPGGKAALPVPMVRAADAALLKSPTSVAVDGAGCVYAANNADATIVKITPEGVVTILAGVSGEPGNHDGKGAEARLNTPRGVAIDAQGNVFVADEYNQNIRRVAPDGGVKILAGGDEETGDTDGKAADARFSGPRGLAVGPDGAVHVADTDNHTIRKITPAREVTTLAGKSSESGAEDGAGPAARFSEPRGVAVDAAGNVFVADTGNAAIRQITPAGVVTTIAAAKAPAATPAEPSTHAPQTPPSGARVD